MANPLINLCRSEITRECKWGEFQKIDLVLINVPPEQEEIAQKALNHFSELTGCLFKLGNYIKFKYQLSVSSESGDCTIYHEIIMDDEKWKEVKPHDPARNPGKR